MSRERRGLGRFRHLVARLSAVFRLSGFLLTKALCVKSLQFRRRCPMVAFRIAGHTGVEAVNRAVEEAPALACAAVEIGGVAVGGVHSSFVSSGFS